MHLHRSPTATMPPSAASSVAASGDTSDPPPALACHGLVKRYGRKEALRGIDLEVPRGHVFGYLGPNGAGKTTTIRILTGLMRPTAGEVSVLGHDIVRDRDTTQRLIGYLPGDFVGYPDLTGQQYLDHLAALRGGVDKTVVDDLASRLEVELDRRIGTLSHGNRQKIGVVQAFMHQPELLVLDEPTAGLDPLVQRQFLQLLREVRSAGCTVFLSSHVLSEVEAVADMVAILRDGEVVVTDTLGRLEQKAVRRLELTLSEVPDLDTLRQAAGVLGADLLDHTVQVTVEGSTSGLMRAAVPYGVENVVSHEADLEEIFLRLYQEGATS